MRAMGTAFSIRGLAWLAFAAAVLDAHAAEPARAASPASDFGRDIVRAYNARDVDAAARLYDFAELGRRAGRMAADEPRQRAAFAAGVESAAKDKMLAVQMANFERTGATAKLMRVAGANPGRPLVRVEFGGKGFDYFEFIIERGKDGRHRAVDWYQLTQGQLASETMGRIGSALAGSSATALERLFGAKDTSGEVLRQFQQINAATRAGNYREVIARTKALPEPFASARQVLTLRASAATMGQLEDEYKLALAQLAAKHAADPAAAFMLLDHYFFEHQTGKIIEALLTLEKRVGADGVTSFMKANAYLDAKDYEQTIRWAREASRYEEELEGPHQVIATAHIALKRYAEAIEEYRVLEQSFGYQFKREHFAEQAEFAEFAKSAAFDQWLPKP